VGVLACASALCGAPLLATSLAQSASAAETAPDCFQTPDLPGCKWGGAGGDDGGAYGDADGGGPDGGGSTAAPTYNIQSDGAADIVTRTDGGDMGWSDVDWVVSYYGYKNCEMGVVSLRCTMF
jgi:hypothetical protein